MKSATYHLLEEPHKKAVQLQVLKQNEDGTVDLGDVESGELRVGSCKVTAEPKHGHCTLDADAPSDESADSKPKAKKK